MTGLEQSCDVLICKLKTFAQVAETTTDMGMGARINPEITVRDYWSNSGKKFGLKPE